MYKCEICGNISQPNIPAHKITVKTERTTYPRREKVFAYWKQENGRRKFARPDDPGGVGQQIVRELTACSDCAKNANGNNR